MEFEAIATLVADYEEALKVEYHNKCEAQEQADGIAEKEKVLIADAYASGDIDGKNAETRKAQEQVVLLSDPWLPKAREVLKVKEHRAMGAEIRRKATDARISLTRAWLYSQARIS